MEELTSLLNLAEFEPAAAKKLPRMVFDYYAGGAGDEVTLRAARTAWDQLELRYRVLRGTGTRSLATRVLGEELALPVLVAPMALQRMAHPDGELATARAASAAGVGMALSTLANTPVEEVRGATTGVLWFQLYIYKDRDLTRDIVARAERAGCTALVLTVDAPVLGWRERDARNGFRVDDQLTVPNLTADARSALAGRPSSASALSAFVHGFWDENISWADVDWLRSITRLPILVKGIVHADDARLALEHGAAGVVVSNHGGRQLDTAIASARALPAIADALAGRGTILVDGGIRRGTDVVKAIALGATAVLLGRPVLWGLALGGAEGVARVFAILRGELDLALALVGAKSPAELTRDLLHTPG